MLWYPFQTLETVFIPVGINRTWWNNGDWVWWVSLVACAFKGSKLMMRLGFPVLSTYYHPIAPCDWFAYWNWFYYSKLHITIKVYLHLFVPINWNRERWMVHNWFSIPVDYELYYYRGSSNQLKWFVLTGDYTVLIKYVYNSEVSRGPFDGGVWKWYWYWWREVTLKAFAKRCCWFCLVGSCKVICLDILNGRKRVDDQTQVMHLYWGRTCHWSRRWIVWFL